MSSTPVPAPDLSPRRERLLLAAAAVALTALFGVLHTLQLGAAATQRGETFVWGRELGRVLAHWWVSLAFVPALALAVRAAPLGRGRIVRHGALLLAATVLASVARALLDPALALALGDPAVPALRVPRVLAALAGFLAIVGMLHAVHFHRELRAREREAARLARSLAAAELAASRAELAALRAQLQPHFLFNTLNAIVALLHHDPVTADRMLTRLSAFLRGVLQAPPAPEHPLRDELALLDQYLELMALRFGARLGIERAVDPAALDAMVPWMLLQPLAENALEHGLWPRPGAGTLALRAAREGSALRIVVEDDGIGLPSRAGDAAGIGLANTRHRLAHLHGDAAALLLEPRPGGGARAVVTLPLRTAPAAAHEAREVVHA